MAYDIKKRSFGEGFTYWLAHGSGAGYDASGEALYETLVSASANLGLYSKGSTLQNESETILDKVAQESYPIQSWVSKSTAIFKPTVSMGDSTWMALATGLDALRYTSQTIDGETFDIVVGGVSYPQFISLLHRIRNPHDASLYFDIYMPRVKVDGNLILELSRENVRESEINFHLLASRQDMMEDKWGNGAAFKFYNQTTNTYNYVQRYESGLIASSTEWDVEHGLSSGSIATLCEDTGFTVITPTSIKPQTPDWLQTKFGSSETGYAVCFAAGVSSEIGSDGASEVQRVYTAATQWTITARDFAYGSQLVVVCLDQYGNQITPSSMVLTSGAVDTGNVVINFSSAQKGSALIFKEGANGENSASHISSNPWTVSIPSASAPALIQCWDSGGNWIQPTTQDYDAGTELYTLTFSADQAGSHLAIY